MKFHKSYLFLFVFLLSLLSGCHQSTYIIGNNRVYVGNSIQLTIANPSNDDYDWESNDEAIASVINGEVFGISEGEVVISLIKADNVIATLTLEVLLPPSLLITGADFVFVDESIQLDVESTIDNEVFFWTSSDESIATVTDGFVSGIQVGTVEIIVTSSGFGSASIVVDVIDNLTPKNIEIINTLDTYIIEEGPYQLEAIAYPHYASQDIYWEVTGKKAAIDQESGIITFFEEGIIYVTCRSKLDDTVFKVIALLAQHHESTDITRVLFIGNSLTYVNDIPKMMQNMAQSSGKVVYCDSITQGGQFIDEAYTNFNQTILNLLNTKQYDYMILQEQSSGSFKQYQRFLDGVKTFNELAIEYDIEVILYQTWPYKEGSSALLSNNMTQQEMLNRIVESYHNVATEIGVQINPVGEVFYAFLQAYPSIELYMDANHASLAGSYLSSCVHYVKLFNESVVGNSYSIGLDSETIHAIQVFVSDYCY